jgi:hypothetical protein
LKKKIDPNNNIRFMDNLPYDIIEIIYQKLHKLYMNDLHYEIYEKANDFEERYYEKLDDPDYEPSEDSDSDSEDD